MSPRTIAHRYAKALFDLARRQNELEAIQSEVEALLTLYRSSSLFRLLLESPIYRAQQKMQWIRPLLESRLKPLLWTFIQLLVRRGREPLLYQTCEAFLELCDEYQRRVRAQVRSAYPLSSKAKADLVQRLQSAFAAEEIVLTEEVDPSLIGGFILEVGMRAADLSVRTRLQEIRKKLLQTQSI
ncbi:MAG: ATP synthase F1 subunit delta [Bacteroidia bacterium]|nr:ATP synthase F1 subunit delta [Bacteroidia bacterium]MDW8015026.1 ATP synthase F1 subunit delta [Bacteroidia bacterium]